MFSQISRVAPILLAVSGLVLASCRHPEKDFAEAKRVDTEAAYQDFIKKHPESPLVPQAEAAIVEKVFSACRTQGTVAAYVSFLQRFGSGPRADEARGELERLEFDQAVAAATTAAWEEWLARYPQSARRTDGRARLAGVALQQALAEDGEAALAHVIERFSDTTPAAEARQHLTTRKLASVGWKVVVPASGRARFFDSNVDDAIEPAWNEHLFGVMLEITRTANDTAGTLTGADIAIHCDTGAALRPATVLVRHAPRSVIGNL
jgi:hypothetical protein